MTEDDAGNPMIRKTYQLSVSDDPQKLPVADFERDGRRYYLLDITKEDKIGVDTKEHSETVKLSSDTKEMEQILQRLDAQKEVTTEDGHGYEMSDRESQLKDMIMDRIVEHFKGALCTN